MQQIMNDKTAAAARTDKSTWRKTIVLVQGRNINISKLFYRNSPLTVTVKEQIAVFPLTSVAVYVTRVTPIEKLEPDWISLTSWTFRAELSVTRGIFHLTRVG